MSAIAARIIAIVLGRDTARAACRDRRPRRRDDAWRLSGPARCRTECRNECRGGFPAGTPGSVPLRTARDPSARTRPSTWRVTRNGSASSGTSCGSQGAGGDDGRAGTRCVRRSVTTATPPLARLDAPDPFAGRRVSRRAPCQREKAAIAAADFDEAAVRLLHGDEVVRHPEHRELRASVLRASSTSCGRSCSRAAASVDGTSAPSGGADFENAGAMQQRPPSCLFQLAPQCLACRSSGT